MQHAHAHAHAHAAMLCVLVQCDQLVGAASRRVNTHQSNKAHPIEAKEVSWGTAKGTMLRSIKPFQLTERQLDATWHKEREQCVSGEGRRDDATS